MGIEKKKKNCNNITQVAPFFACGRLIANAPFDLVCIHAQAQGLMTNYSYKVKPRDKVCK